MNHKRKSSLLLGVAALTLGGWLSACDRNEGPAEEVGEAIDQSNQSTGKALENMGDKMEDAGENMQH